MRSIIFILAFIFGVLQELSFGGVEPIPDHWKKNPNVRIIYRVKKAIPGWGAPSIPPGREVAVSVRSLENLMIYDYNPKERNLGVNLVGTPNDQDGGTLDGFFPFKDFANYLEPTTRLAPLKHWQISHSQAADKDFINLKPNYSYHHSFPIQLYPAWKTTGERPRLIAHGIEVRLIQPSPLCHEDEFTVRLYFRNSDYNAYRRQRRANNPDLALVGEWFGSDYCLWKRDFVNEGFQQGILLATNLQDSVTWEEFKEKYNRPPSQFAEKRNSKILISPFSDADEAAGRSGPYIRVVPVSSLDEESQRGLPVDGYLASYGGPLYYACAGGSCRVQGYTIVLTADGKVDRMLKNNLYYAIGSDEFPFESYDVERIVRLCNDKPQLEKVYAWAKGNQGDSYTAQMSGLSKMAVDRRAGNTYGTVVIHLSKIREKLFKDEWPLYDGPAPGGQ